MRVLVLTNHFAAFCGSEIVALEVAQWFRAQGDSVTLGANFIAQPIQAWANGIALCESPTTLALEDYDLIWCQHDMLAQLPLDAFISAATLGQTPHVAMISLSPFEPYEKLDARLVRALSAEVMVNSVETGREVLRQAEGQILASRVRPFYNAAPAAFMTSASPAPPGPLKSVVLISNRAPAEAAEALALLEAAGVSARYIGEGRDYRLVQPDDIAGADAVISIGKSVVYALAQRKPVYVYDYLGGDGWLTPENFADNQAHNFTGRPARQKRTPQTIASEILEGYAAAAEGMQRLDEFVDMRLLSLEHHLSALRGRALRSVKAWRSLTLGAHLLNLEFREHLQNASAFHKTKRTGYLEMARRQG